MRFQKKRTIHMLSKLGKVVAFFLIGGVLIHTLTMLFDYYLITEPIYLNLHGNFAESIFSISMIPMMVAYGIFSLMIYFFWDREKKAILLASTIEVQSEKTEAVLKSMQRLTGILAEHIAAHNTEIIRWIESRKKRGQTVSQKVERPARKIAKALQSLSVISFVFPYTGDRPKDVDDIETVLRSKLDDVTGIQKRCDRPVQQVLSN